MTSRSCACLSLLVAVACSSARDPGKSDSAGGNASAGAAWQTAGSSAFGGNANAGNGGISEPNAGTGACPGAGCAGTSEQGGAAGEACVGAECPLACGLHRFSYDARGRHLDSVQVAGSFNDWRADGANALEYSISAGTWSGVFDLGAGDFSYKLLLNGNEWLTDPSNPVLDQSQNSVLKISCPVTCSGNASGFDWHDQVLYSLLIDRFADSDRKGSSPSPGGNAQNPRFGYGGGDLQGVRQHLSYLTDLGVSGIWLSPPTLNGLGGYHGYYPAPPNVSFDAQGNPSPEPQVDPHFGSVQDLHDLMQSAHGAGGYGLRVVLDYVMKHVHQSSALTSAQPGFFVGQGQNIKTCDNGTADPGDDLWTDPVWKTKCSFNSWLWPFDYAASPAALAWSMNDASWWAKTFDFDGFRLDAISHVSPLWPEALRERVTQQFGSRSIPLYLFGETFDYGRGALRPLIDPRRRLDGQLDFPLRGQLAEALLLEHEPLSQLASWITQNDRYYGVEAKMATFIGNHDLPRAIHYAAGQIPTATTGSNKDNNAAGQYLQPSDAAPYQRLTLAFAVLLTSPGVPVIYYGDEIGLAGGGDPENRRMMPWREEQLLPAQKALRDSVHQLLAVRAKYRVLSRGTRENLFSDSDTWLYRMSACSAWRSVLVAINRSPSERTLVLPPGTHRDALSDQPSSASLTLAPRSFRILLESVTTQ